MTIKTAEEVRTVDVALVSMPFGALQRPSIGLSILKASAEQAGICTDILYGSFPFADQIGLKAYRVLSEYVDVADLIGEWVFAEAAFADYEPDHQEYLNDILSPSKYNLAPLQAYLGKEKLKEKLLRIRKQATLFVSMFAEQILNSNPKIVGCSSVFQQHCASIALLKHIKSVCPEVITMIGGANCEGEMGLTTAKHFPWIDFVVSGEADLVFADLCKTVLTSADSELDHHDIPVGVISTKLLENKYLISPPRAKLNSIDLSPIPDYTDYIEQLANFSDSHEVVPGLLLETSRGCWWGQKKHCTFCGLNGNGMAYRSKSPTRVLNELAHLEDKYGITKFEVVDNILDTRYFATVIKDLANSDLSYSIFYETKSNLTEEEICALSKAGIKWIQPGIESLNDNILSHINKGNSAIANVALLKFALENGMRVSWNFLFGFPNEQDSWYVDMANWIPQISHLQPPSHLVRVRYDRFSPYFTDPDSFMINLSPNKSYRFIYPIPKTDLYHIAYFFEDYTDTERGLLDKPGISRVKEWVVKANTKFFSKNRPKLLLLESENSALILDTRDCAIEPITYLDQQMSLVYKLCRTPQTIKSLTRKLDKMQETSLCSSDIVTIVDKFIETKLILEINGKILSLATKPPIDDIPSLKDFPGGYY